METPDAASQVDSKDPNLLYGPPPAQWVLAVLDECADKLGICSDLTPEILKDKMIDAMDHELIVALQEHFHVEEEYINLLKALDSADQHGAEDRAFYENNQKLKPGLYKVCADSTRTLCRLLRQPHNSIVVRRLRELSVRRSPGALEFLSTFARLRDLVHIKLKTTAEEENQIDNQLKLLLAQKKSDEKRYQEYKQQLQHKIKQHMESKLLKTRKIDRLRKQRQTLEDETNRTRAHLKRTMAEQEKANKAAFETELKRLQEEYAQLSSKLEEGSKTNWSDEMKQHRQIMRKGEAVQLQIQAYDDEMMERMKAFEDLKKLHTDERQELHRLRVDFEKHMEENKRVQSEIARIKRDRNDALLEGRKRNHAAVLMQKLYLNFQDNMRKAERARRAAEREKEADKKK